MKKNTEIMIEEFKDNYPEMANLDYELRYIIAEISDRIKKGGKILVCGNGGSASDSEHIVGELLKEFYIRRPIDGEFHKKLLELYPREAHHMIKCLQGGIPAISLVSQTGFLSAYGNDVSYDMAYAQQVYVYGEENDIFIGLSTSGNSSNVLYGAKVARAKGMFVIGITGESGGKLKDISHIILDAPAKETYRVQEYHLPLYHLICRAIEYEIFGEEI